MRGVTRGGPVLLHHFFEDTARRLPAKTALVCRNERYTYGEIETRVGQLAQLLRACGVARGDRVLLFLDNGIEAVCGIYAALRIGAAFVPVNPLTKQAKLAYLLNDARPSALITQASLRGAWEGALACNATVRTCLVAGDAQALPERCIAYPFLGRQIEAGAGEAPVIDQDLAAIIYTSGSTGEPKGVMLSHLNMVSAARSVSGYLGLREDDVVLCALPLAFDYGLYQLLMAFKQGATLVLERSFAFPVKVLESMAAERVTVLPGVPSVFSLLMHLDCLPRFDLRALRMITSTGAALSEEHIRRLRALFPQAALYSMYGLTECKRVSYLPPEELERRPGSVGRGMPNQELWLVDEAGRRLPNGSSGELVVRGSHVMLGYWGKAEETAERLKPGPLPGERVLHTGDLFRTDEEGWLYFLARKDDIIKSRGEKVSPREVEDVLYGIAGVQEAAVIGVPDALLGQAIKAFVVPKNGYHLTEREIIRRCLGRLENFMAPKCVEFVPELPKTETGKIKKTDLA